MKFAARGLSYRALAAQTYYSKSFLHELAQGRKHPNLETATRIDEPFRPGRRTPGGRHV